MLIQWHKLVVYRWVGIYQVTKIFYCSKIFNRDRNKKCLRKKKKYKSSTSEGDVFLFACFELSTWFSFKKITLSSPVLFLAVLWEIPIQHSLLPLLFTRCPGCSSTAWGPIATDWFTEVTVWPTAGSLFIFLEVSNRFLHYLTGGNNIAYWTQVPSIADVCQH